MKEIKLNKGFFAQVDDEDYEYLNQFRWYICSFRGKHYAIRHIQGSRPKMVLMHREIMKALNGTEIDHKDRNSLNNQKCNLRFCTRSQNNMNKAARGKSQYLGVSYLRKYIQAKIRINGKTTHLGYFKTEQLAAYAYDEAAKKYHGEFANLNFK